MLDLNRLTYTYEEAAELLGYSVAFVRWAAKTGKLRPVDGRKNIIVSGTSVRQFFSRYHGFPPTIKPSGYIYLIRFMHYHKIGLSGDVKKRLQAINQGLPERATLVHAIPTNDMLKAEAMLHTQYAHCRSQGEWFHLSSQEVDLICSIKGFWY